MQADGTKSGWTSVAMMRKIVLSRNMKFYTTGKTVICDIAVNCSMAVNINFITFLRVIR